MPGPLQVIAVSFSPGSDFQARVLAEVDRLQGRGVLRLLDVIFVAKNEDGTIEPVVVGGDDDDFGALLSRILPLGGGGLVEPTGEVGSSGFVWMTRGRWQSPCCLGRRSLCCSSSTAGRRRSLTRSLSLVGRCWGKAFSPPKPGWSSGPRSRRWRRRLR